MNATVKVGRWNYTAEVSRRSVRIDREGTAVGRAVWSTQLGLVNVQGQVPAEVVAKLRTALSADAKAAPASTKPSKKEPPKKELSKKEAPKKESKEKTEPRHPRDEKPGRRLVQISLWFEPQERAEIDELAERDGVTTSTAIVNAVRDALRGSKKPKKAPHKRQAPPQKNRGSAKPMAKQAA